MKENTKNNGSGVYETPQTLVVTVAFESCVANTTGGTENYKENSLDWDD